VAPLPGGYKALDLQPGVQFTAAALSSSNLRQVVHTDVPLQLGQNGLAMTWLTAVWEAAAGYVYHDSHCDVQPWARAAHPSCSAQVDSAFHPPWDGKMSISFRAE